MDSRPPAKGNRKPAGERNFVMHPVQSSLADKIGHHAPSKTLRVKFPSGAVYDYFNVDGDEHERLVQAESIGAHFGRHIRGKKDYERVS